MDCKYQHFYTQGTLKYPVERSGTPRTRAFGRQSSPYIIFFSDFVQVSNLPQILVLIRPYLKDLKSQNCIITSTLAYKVNILKQIYSNVMLLAKRKSDHQSFQIKSCSIRRDEQYYPGQYRVFSNLCRNSLLHYHKTVPKYGPVRMHPQLPAMYSIECNLYFKRKIKYIEKVQLQSKHGFDLTSFRKDFTSCRHISNK